MHTRGRLGVAVLGLAALALLLGGAGQVRAGILPPGGGGVGGVGGGAGGGDPLWA